MKKSFLLILAFTVFWGHAFSNEAFHLASAEQVAYQTLIEMESFLKKFRQAYAEQKAIANASGEKFEILNCLLAKKNFLENFFQLAHTSDGRMKKSVYGSSRGKENAEAKYYFTEFQQYAQGFEAVKNSVNECGLPQDTLIFLGLLDSASPGQGLDEAGFDVPSGFEWHAASGNEGFPPALPASQF